jgi:hypothetical protein
MPPPFFDSHLNVIAKQLSVAVTICITTLIRNNHSVIPAKAGIQKFSVIASSQQ